MHLHVDIGAGRAGPQLVDVGQPPILGHQLDDPRAHLVGQFVVHQLAGRLAEHADRAPEQQRGDDQRGDRVEPGDPQPGGRRYPCQGDEVGGEIRGVVRPVARHSHGGGLLQHPALGGDQEPGEQDRDRHHRHRPATLLDRLGGHQVADRLAGDQGGGGEHQPGLHQAGESFRLAVAVAVLGVRRRHGIADGEEGGQRRQEVEAGVGRRRQQGDRPRGQPGRDLDRHQHRGGRDRIERHAPGQGGALDGGQAMGGVHGPEPSRVGAARQRERLSMLSHPSLKKEGCGPTPPASALAPHSATAGGSASRRPAVRGHGRSTRPPGPWRRRR